MSYHLPLGEEWAQGGLPRARGQKPGGLIFRPGLLRPRVLTWPTGPRRVICSLASPAPGAPRRELRLRTFSHRNQGAGCPGCSPTNFQVYPHTKSCEGQIEGRGTADTIFVNSICFRTKLGASFHTMVDIFRPIIGKRTVCSKNSLSTNVPIFKASDALVLRFALSFQKCNSKINTLRFTESRPSGHRDNSIKSRCRVALVSRKGRKPDFRSGEGNKET